MTMLMLMRLPESMANPAGRHGAPSPCPIIPRVPFVALNAS